MKLKYVYSLIGFSVLFLIYNISSMANNPTLDIYKNIEGEYISIENSNEDIIHDIEIFGNTIQDSDNLDDIQSVGDLYTDDEGNPILDKQGRKQYKIDIATINKNLCDESNSEKDSRYYKYYDIPVKSEQEYTIFYKDAIRDTGRISVKAYDAKGSLLEEKFVAYNWYGYYTTPANSVKIDIEIDTWWHDGVEANKPNVKLAVHEGKKEGMVQEEYVTQIKNITSLLIPTQLRKIGTVSDRLYWDSKNNKYMIEKNILEYTTPTLTYNGELNINVNLPSDMIASENMISDYPFIFEGAKVRGWVLETAPGFNIKRYKDSNYIRLATSSTYTNEEISQKVSNKKVYYITTNPVIVDTEITKRLNLSSYLERTHITTLSQNNIKANIRISIDKIEEVAQEQVVATELNPTIENISLSRNLINQMKESTLKDQLQDKLNNIFNLNNFEIEKLNTTSYSDVYIKMENNLTLSLSTNTITFDNYSSVEDNEMFNAVEISVSSSLPYSINVYLESEIYNSDKSEKLEKSILNIKSSNSDLYKTFSDISTPIVLIEENESGNTNTHGIDIKFSGGLTPKADVYKTILKFEVVQR